MFNKSINNFKIILLILLAFFMGCCNVIYVVIHHYSDKKTIYCSVCFVHDPFEALISMLLANVAPTTLALD